MTRFRDGAAISLVALAAQQRAGARVLVVTAEQPSRGEQPRGKVEGGQPLLRVPTQWVMTRQRSSYSALAAERSRQAQFGKGTHAGLHQERIENFLKERTAGAGEHVLIKRLSKLLQPGTMGG